MRGYKHYCSSQAILNKIYLNDENKYNLYREYLKLLRKSAYLGYSDAQFELALQSEEYFIFGKNSKYSERKCEYWYQKACENNNADACNSLGVLMDSRNKRTDAIDFYKKAIVLGSELAKKNLKEK